MIGGKDSRDFQEYHECKILTSSFQILPRGSRDPIGRFAGSGRDARAPGAASERAVRRRVRLHLRRGGRPPLQRRSGRQGRQEDLRVVDRPVRSQHRRLPLQFRRTRGRKTWN